MIRNFRLRWSKKGAPPASYASGAGMHAAPAPVCGGDGWCLWVPCAVKGALVGAERRCGGARSVADFKAENLTLASYTEVVSIRIRGSRNQRHTRRLLAPTAARAHGLPAPRARAWWSSLLAPP